MLSDNFQQILIKAISKILWLCSCSSQVSEPKGKFALKDTRFIQYELLNTLLFKICTFMLSFVFEPAVCIKLLMSCRDTL